VTVIEQDPLTRCALCAQVAVEVLPMPRPSGDNEDPRPAVPLCVSHRREWVGGAPTVGWCPGAGGHYGRRSRRCDRHGAVFTDPFA
jgi:hypothetical protein